ncbi:MAG: response regulator [Chloroflexi bacterium]|jgi:two-component system cell cycle response regulator DivK|nr:response regulator [Chloroflexota bacterium]MDL1885028.1 response regulator [Anaerolineae bacterium CFX8]
MNQTHALIFDDNIKNVNVLARLLAEQAVSSTPVMNSRMVDTILNTSGKIDVVFLDLEMPGLNGFEVLQKLQASPRFENVPIVAYTVHVSEINEARQRGFHSFIGKPLDPDRFPEQLDRILRGEPVWETA